MFLILFKFKCLNFQTTENTFFVKKIAIFLLDIS